MADPRGMAGAELQVVRDLRMSDQEVMQMGKIKSNFIVRRIKPDFIDTLAALDPDVRNALWDLLDTVEWYSNWRWESWESDERDDVTEQGWRSLITKRARRLFIAVTEPTGGRGMTK